MFAAVHLGARAFKAQVAASVVLVGAAAAAGSGSPLAGGMLNAALVASTAYFTRWLVVRLTRLVHHDALTGALSETGLREVGSRPVEGAARSLVLVDIDGFAQINEALGREGGDQVLRGFADAVVRWRPDARVGRLSGDVFALLLNDSAVAGEDALRSLAAAAARELCRPYAVGGVVIDVDVVVGATHGPGGEPFDALLDRATAALAAAKREDRTVRIWSADLSRDVAAELVLQAQLRAGIARGELVLHFQPQFSAHSGGLVGFEALVRWQHPERGLLGPYAFLPLAERSPLIVDLTAWVLDAAVQQAALWQPIAAVPVSVNLSPRLLAHDGLVDLVAGVLAMRGLPPHLLTLEVTETAVTAQPERAREVLGELRSLGIRISLDDFGTGYTSLSMLADLPLDELKVDRKFVAGASAETRDAAIMRSIASLARRLDLDLVAEGIEDEAVQRRLAEWGYDVLQGYLLGRPVPVSGLAQLLQEPSAPSAIAPPAPRPLRWEEELRLADVARAAELVDRALLAAVARLAAQACSTPYAFVSLVGGEDVLAAAAHGCRTGTVPARHSFCPAMVRQAELLEVPDARQDPRFRQLPAVVAGEVRFYAGFPLSTAAGPLGGLCVADSRSRTLSEEQLAALGDLARIVTEHLQARVSLTIGA